MIIIGILGRQLSMRIPSGYIVMRTLSTSIQELTHKRPGFWVIGRSSETAKAHRG
eukprot:TRINITY_DN10454_c0_g1_i1.p2 TRINITY_DN10454_c0_g1~~TRINITY_DN10454_c0_g1_i1.p2  ORF type:complete len:55 (+),score=19.82 TRINITY_DN10454_c0_g1_i1:277-441(+)